MMNVLLFIHIVIAVLLIIVILMQRTGANGLSGIGGGGGNMGVVSGKTVANFLTKTTIIFATLFILNALVLANLSSKKNPEISKQIEEIKDMDKGTSLPMAK